MASPLTVAIGAEAREDTYGIGAGDPASYYKEGAQSFPGFAPTAAGNHSRKNYAGYIDLALAPIEDLQLDVAGRVEHYTDFGDAQIGKITARYDFNPQWAIRGTISTGFRAPTLAEEFYTAVNVSPTVGHCAAAGQLRGGQAAGSPNLKPEISTSYSVGIVAHPLEDLSVTVDAYSIAIGNRITTSATVISVWRRDQCAAGHPGDRAGRCRARSHRHPAGRHRLPERHVHPYPGRGHHRQLSHRFRRLWPGGLDLGGQLQRDGDRRAWRRRRRVHQRSGRCCSHLLPPRHAVQFRPQRAGGEDRSDRELDAG